MTSTIFRLFSYVCSHVGAWDLDLAAPKHIVVIFLFIVFDIISICLYIPGLGARSIPQSLKCKIHTNYNTNVHLPGVVWTDEGVFDVIGMIRRLFFWSSSEISCRPLEPSPPLSIGNITKSFPPVSDPPLPQSGKGQSQLLDFCICLCFAFSCMYFVITLYLCKPSLEAPSRVRMCGATCGAPPSSEQTHP